MIEVGIKDVKDARTVLEEMSFRWTTGPLRRAAMVTQDRAQSMYNATICHRSALPCFPYARRSGALAAVAGQTTTAAIKKDEAQERIEAPHSRAGRRLSRTGRVGHRGFHGAGERKRASLKLFCAAPFVRLVPQKECGRRGGVESWCFFYRNIKTKECSYAL